MLGAIPYAVAFLAMLVNGWHSDRSCERRWHSGKDPASVSACSSGMAAHAKWTSWSNVGGRLEFLEARWAEVPAPGDAVNLDFSQCGGQIAHSIRRDHLPHADQLSARQWVPIFARHRTEVIASPGSIPFVWVHGMAPMDWHGLLPASVLAESSL